MTAIQLERAEDAAAVETLHGHAFGPGRHARSGFLLRGRRAHDTALAFTAWDGVTLAGSIRFTPLSLQQAEGGRLPVLLLGPLAVVKARQGNGLGIKLVTHGLAAARAAGHRIVLLLGEPRYYARAGFVPVAPGTVRCAVPFDPARLLWCGLAEDVCIPSGFLLSG